MNPYGRTRGGANRSLRRTRGRLSSRRRLPASWYCQDDWGGVGEPGRRWCLGGGSALRCGSVVAFVALTVVSIVARTVYVVLRVVYAVPGAGRIDIAPCVWCGRCRFLAESVSNRSIDRKVDGRIGCQVPSCHWRGGWDWALRHLRHGRHRRSTVLA
jgi:hypothetical protein